MVQKTTTFEEREGMGMMRRMGMMRMIAVVIALCGCSVMPARRERALTVYATGATSARDKYAFASVVIVRGIFVEQ